MSAADVTTSAQTPRAEGFAMPAEWAPHERCLIAWPVAARDYWGELFPLAQATHAAVAQAIARFEPVLVVAAPGEGAGARDHCGSDVEVIELPIDDSWIRDSGPILLTRADGARAAADFAFNAWGGKYPPWDKDDSVSELLCDHLGVRRFRAPVVLEGGAITVDGEGTLITTESCLLNPNRNPGLDRAGIEETLREYLGVRKVIWLKEGRATDAVTDGHVDGICHFLGLGRVILHVVRDEHQPGHEASLENRRRLETTDALGRELQVVEFDHMTPMSAGGQELTATYINSYQANGALIVPTAGTPSDERALEKLREILPGRAVVGVPTPVLAFGGGGIHCITQQVPRPRTAER
jgi:agmatine deiminase